MLVSELIRCDGYDGLCVVICGVKGQLKWHSQGILSVCCCGKLSSLGSVSGARGYQRDLSGSLGDG